MHILDLKYKEIEDICSRYNIINFDIDKDLLVNCDSYVNLDHRMIHKIPINFGIINGYFTCRFNNLKDIIGSPKYVINGYYCSFNQISDTIYLPKYIGGTISVSNNNIFEIRFDSGTNIIQYKENPVYDLINTVFENDISLYLEYLDIFNFQKGNIIYKCRLMEILEELGIQKLPITNDYKYV